MLSSRFACLAVLFAVVLFPLCAIFEHYQERSLLMKPTINDVFREHRERKGITIYEIHEMFMLVQSFPF